jgi:predicted XRE-type DNA-binding protein
MSNKLWDAKASEVSPEEYAAIEAEERFVYETQKAVRNLLKDNDMKASDLARLLRVSEARVSQMLGGEARNLTLRSLARIFHAVGSRCVVAREDARQATKSEAPVEQERPAIGQRVAKTADTSDESASGGNLGLWNRLSEPHLLAELSEGAAFGKQSVWVFGSDRAPANENRHPRHARHRSEQVARSWMAAPLPHEKAREQAYA